MHIEVNDNVEQYKKKRGNFTNDLSVCKKRKRQKKSLFLRVQSLSIVTLGNRYCMIVTFSSLHQLLLHTFN